MQNNTKWLSAWMKESQAASNKASSKQSSASEIDNLADFWRSWLLCSTWHDQEDDPSSIWQTKWPLIISSCSISSRHCQTEKSNQKLNKHEQTTSFNIFQHLFNSKTSCSSKKLAKGSIMFYPTFLLGHALPRAVSAHWCRPPTSCTANCTAVGRQRPLGRLPPLTRRRWLRRSRASQLANKTEKRPKTWRCCFNLLQKLPHLFFWKVVYRGRFGDIRTFWFRVFLHTEDPCDMPTPPLS